MKICPNIQISSGLSSKYRIIILAFCLATLICLIAIGLPSLRLVGSSPEDRLAIIEDKNTNQQMVVSPGDLIQGATKVLSIDSGGVKLQSGKSTYELKQRGAVAAHASEEEYNLPYAEMVNSENIPPEGMEVMVVQ